MQKILILVGRSASNINSFYTKLTELLPQEHEVEKAYFEDIIIDIEQNKTTIFFMVQFSKMREDRGCRS